MGCFSKLSWPDRSYYYSLMVVSLLCAKLLHLFSHFSALPLLLFLLYLPTFLLLDIIVVLGGRLLFRFSKIGGISLACLITSSAAAQIGFFVETGGELRWNLMGRIVRELDGFIGLLTSGLLGLMLTIGIMGGVAWLLNPGPYNLAWRFLRWVGSTALPQKIRTKQYRRRNSVAREEEEGLVSSGSSISEKAGRRQCSFLGLTWGRVFLLAFFITEIILLAVRPSSPYTHMSGTLPFTIFESLWTTRSEFCEPIPWDEGAVMFPYPELILQETWTADSTEGFRGWRPGNVDEGPRQKPTWMPEKPLAGFAKWYRKQLSEAPHHRRAAHPPNENSRSNEEDKHDERPPHGPPHGHGKPQQGHQHGRPPRPSAAPPGYDPAADPLKISNMDQPLLPQLEKILKEKKVPIKNILFISLESTRKDVFPLRKEETLYNQIMESRGGKPTPKLKPRDAGSDNWADLSELSKVAEFITGEDAGFGPREPFANFTSGGINFKQAITGSTFTLKSLVGSHCGANSLAVDFLEELEVEIYQPCLPQILDLFNQKVNTLVKPEAGEEHDWPWLNSTWNSVFMQGATGKFDRMGPFIDYIGFQKAMHREEIADPHAKYPPKNGPINYFGYSESELKPYIRDLFVNAKEKNERVFLSHITTTTHHPWATPPDYGPRQAYWGGKHAGNSAWNSYLNSVNYADKWLLEVLQLLKEVGAEEETLVIYLGDHGFGFGEDTMAKTTYANPHITNFYVPMVFRHPQLNFDGELNGVVHVNTTVSSMSIVPTILDLLVTTGSLPKELHTPAKYLQNEFEGQSLIRTFIPEVPVSFTAEDGEVYNATRSTWSFGVINPGGTHFSVISQNPRTPYRLVLPVCEQAPYRFSDLSKDYYETEVFESWEKGHSLKKAIGKKFGWDAAEWVSEAEKIAGWSLWEGRRRWGYDGGTRREDRGAEHNDDGKLVKDHWWET